MSARPQPLDELADRGADIDAIWGKLDAHELPTREEWLALIEAQRRARKEWLRKQEERER